MRTIICIGVVSLSFAFAVGCSSKGTTGNACERDNDCAQGEYCKLPSPKPGAGAPGKADGCDTACPTTAAEKCGGTAATYQAFCAELCAHEISDAQRMCLEALTCAEFTGSAAAVMAKCGISTSSTGTTGSAGTTGSGDTTGSGGTTATAGTAGSGGSASSAKLGTCTAMTRPGTTGTGGGTTGTGGGTTGGTTGSTGSTCANVGGTWQVATQCIGNGSATIVQSAGSCSFTIATSDIWANGSGSVSGNAMTFSGQVQGVANQCTATVSGSTASGTCTSPDGPCTFTATR